MITKVDSMIPVEIVFENGTRLAHVGVVTAIRGDGCYEISFPSAHCFISAKGKPLRYLRKKEGFEAAWEGIPDRVFKVNKPLMPRRVKK